MGEGERLPVGLEERVHSPLWAGTLRCCSGHGSTTARGGQALVHGLLRAVALIC
jgi:hypothetical protein